MSYLKQPCSCTWPDLRLLTSILILSPINPLFSKWSLSFRFRNQNLVFFYLSSNTFDMPNPSYRSWFSYANDIWWGMKIMKLFIMQFSSVFSHLPLLVTNILRNTLLSDTLCYCSSLRMEHQVSRQCKIQAKLHCNIF